MTDSGGNIFSRIPSYSVILIMIVMVVIGAGIMPLLNIQYTPSSKQNSLSVNFRWNGASARVIETEVTSKIEGVLAAVKGVDHVSSVSYREGGSVSVSFKKNVNVDVLRFEIASLMRQIYPKLPEGVSYPSLSSAPSGEQLSPVLIYTLNAGVPSQQIQQYAEENIVKELARIKGVGNIGFSGATPFYVEVCFDPDKLDNFGISIDELHNGIGAGLERQDIVGNIVQEDRQGEVNEITVMLGSGGSRVDFESIPIKNIDGTIVSLGDLASVAYKEQLPAFYFRINGLNTINLSVTPEKYVNTIDLSKRVRERMEQLGRTFPDGYSATLSYDSSDYIKGELRKIVFRTVLSVIILLLFVFLVSRKLRYLFIIVVTLAANIFIAFIFYYFLNLEIHLYSLAGITVSLGIIIDTSIIMIDHYGYYRDRKAFIAILAAVMTTVGSLAIVFFLPEQQRVNLVDFSAVMIVNLMISIVVALIFVPALMDKLPIAPRKRKNTRRKMRRLLRFNRIYGRYILFGKRHKWIFIVVMILGFGLPVHLLPERIKTDPNQEDKWWPKTYNKTIGSVWYQENMKSIVEKSLGGSLRFFMKNMSGGNYYREPQRTTLSIRAAMPEGCTVQQLNDIMKMMENFLSQFDEIDMFKTSIYGYNDGSIEVTFKKDAEHTGFPLFLKNTVISQAINYGGATWGVYGIDQNGFNNNVYSGYKSHRITLTGYNYDQLYRYAEDVVKQISKNKRVGDPGIYGQVRWGNNLSRNEFYIAFHPDRIALNGIDLYSLYNSMRQKLYNGNVGSYFDGESSLPVALVSSQRDRFDVWRLSNEYLRVNGQNARFSEFGDIAKRRTGNDIYKDNQQYRLIVAYDFVGPYELAEKTTRTEVERLNEEVLPIGFKAETDSYNWGGGGPDANRQYWLILLVITIIYFCCAVLFESLTEPLIILSLIPISFIGVFLTFGITGYTFDQGGFAAFVLLCGTVVNAGIYIINHYNLTCKVGNGVSMHNFLKAYNHKIIPISLTILSSVLGLIPFLYDGESEVFWFAFAVGTMGGMLFSVIALVFFLPLFVPVGRRQRRKRRKKLAATAA